MNRGELVKKIKGRKVLAWINIGHDSVLVEVAPSKITKALYESDSYEFLDAEVRDLESFVEIRKATT